MSSQEFPNQTDYGNVLLLLLKEEDAERIKEIDS